MASLPFSVQTPSVRIPSVPIPSLFSFAPSSHAKSRSSSGGPLMGQHSRSTKCVRTVLTKNCNTFWRERFSIRAALCVFGELDEHAETLDEQHSDSMPNGHGSCVWMLDERIKQVHKFACLPVSWLEMCISVVSNLFHSCISSNLRTSQSYISLISVLFLVMY